LGSLSDKSQKRKGIAIFGYVLSAISKPFMGLAVSWLMVFGARFTDRFVQELVQRHVMH
jgi:hypothetical protein